MVVCEDIHIEDYDMRRHSLKTMEREDLVVSLFLFLLYWVIGTTVLLSGVQENRSEWLKWCLTKTYVFALHSLLLMSSPVIVFNVNVFTYHLWLQCLRTILGVISGRETESMRDFYLCYPAILTNTSPSTKFVVNTPKPTRGGTRCTYNLPLFGDWWQTSWCFQRGWSMWNCKG